MNKNKMRSVVIVGRLNVGKSTLFNRLSEHKKSITYDMPGVTRDFVSDISCWKDCCFELADTGGFSLRKGKDVIITAVQQKAEELLKKADLILFVCDGTVGPTQEDHEIANFLHKLGKKVLLVINKGDDKRAIANTYLFDRLGFAPTFLLSAEHGTGIAELLDAIVAELPFKGKGQEEKVNYKIVILGKPNVGKSSLMNLLLQEERTLVTEQAGTTREAISEQIQFYQETLQLTDTPGIRRQRAVSEQLEKLMVKRAFGALEDTNVVLLLVDATEGQLTDQELKLAFYIFEQGKGLIILFNKVDLIDKSLREQMLNNVKEHDYFFSNIPFLWISCKSGENIGKILPLVREVWHNYSQKFSSEKVFQIFIEALRERPLFRQGKKLLLYDARFVSRCPPKILLLVNEPLLFGETQRACLEKLLRKQFSLKGVPIKFVIRKKKIINKKGS